MRCNVEPVTFHLVRDVDESGASGVGIVADGIRFGDGTCAVHWRTEHTSTTVYRSVADVLAIHGHGGKTRLVFEGVNECDARNRVHPFLRGCFHFALDDNENAPHSTLIIGGGPAPGWSVPDYISPEDADAYRDGYEYGAASVGGPGWRTLLGAR